MDDTIRSAVEQSLRKHYFSQQPADYLDTDRGQRDLMDHVSRRLDATREQIIPWLDDALPLKGARILEIGCGTGSDIIAYVEQGASVVAVDIDEGSLESARARCAAYGIDADLRQANATDVPSMFAGQAFDFIIFYASIEHMTHEERLSSMSGTWQMLAPGGLWCIIETPNRLWYHDSHTSLMPFFHWLPDELAFRSARLSERENFRELYNELTPEQMMHFLRRGRGASFHEFSLAMKPADQLDVVSSKVGFHTQPRRAFEPTPQPTIAQRYQALLREIAPQLHPGFTEEYLDLIIRKD